ncbi:MULTISPECIES: stage VI sporulation protein F [unclassified Halomonas]|uniref:stage VI sporulation protein F n=1 Tax=unclassified Halomonas TaxID=2609666 RepID=UPI001EF62DC4|nr:MULTISPECIES: stage VI sporulation protein F [unclassified Halomonas]MCG7578452.1 stage VI sporulation protein F [Halomonas sp. MMH1-48]MCG7605564.1 stage VI sporulation protein F [Halomonas sp. MM17-34]MCG7614734.1 stage VI sporulation protein F [Halomonas sp. MM17-29]MCG7621630.1 stage VI sporulation protein F [Halomonas sp. DSH1-27]
MSRRLIRLAAALAKGPVTREQADRIAPASNGPHFIGVLRRKLEIDLDCDRVPFTTKDGEPSWYGRYTPTPEERAKLMTFVVEQGGCLDD